MQLASVPRLGPRYWTAIIIASVFGANLGDFVSHVLHLGHVRGLPVLAALLTGVLLAERRTRWPGEVWYWAAIVILRTAATNLADLATHDLRIAYPRVIAGLALLTILLARRGARRAGPGISPATDGWYWATMLTAGTLGTAIGDFTSDLGLGSGLGTVLLAAILAVALAWGSRSNWATRLAYWGCIVAVRSAGTTAGDFCAFGQGLRLGLPLSTGLSGVALVAVLMLWRDGRRHIQAVPTQ
jgi:uncharacterized membrane-anchored protein